MAEPFVADPDFTLYVGDVRAVIAQLPDESVDCVVTSPPYWGLRDYGHDGQIGLEQSPDCLGWATGDECGECFVCSLVGVFRDLRRVLVAHGTCWLNLGDTYASKARGSDEGWATSRLTNPASQQKVQAAALRKDGQRHRGKLAGLKEKDLAGIPWRVALALQADGWWLRSDVIWSKPNVMPESTTDRPTKAHEYVFLLAKSPRYYFDRDAVREPHSGQASGNVERFFPPAGHSIQNVHLGRSIPWAQSSVGRNVRTVWEIATQPYKGAHFAVFPPRLAERCVLAGCPPEVCTVCGKPRVRIVEKGDPVVPDHTWSATGAARYDDEEGDYVAAGGASTLKHVVPRETVGWTDCGHDAFRAGVVLDPFMGSGTTALVARAARRHAIGIEINPTYADLCARRLSQQSLLTENAA